jgi:AcrR family transcriptional regulator
MVTQVLGGLVIAVYNQAMISGSRRRVRKTTPRLGVESSETRAQLIRLAARLIRDEGCAAVTAGRLAGELGLKRQIVHYYFGTIEDLLIAVIRRSVGKLHDRARQELNSGEPLRAIWRLANVVTTGVYEFSAMAMRSAAIKVEMKHYTEEFRRIQAQAIARHLELRGIAPSISPTATAFVINSLVHTLVLETAVDVTEGHAEMKALLEEWLQAFAQDGDWSPRAKRNIRKTAC